MHAKNLNALLNYNFDITTINEINLLNMDLSKYDVIYSPCVPIDVRKYPKTKFLFGPHFSVFPNKNAMDLISGNNSLYIQPSDWAVDVWKNNEICKHNRFAKLPFGVDTERFSEIKPIRERNKIFIYTKRRNPKEIEFVVKFLQKFNIDFKLFDYVSKYNETDFIEYLQESKYGIWIDAHESQGFALEEALSCNVPLLVWNIKSMSQEYGSQYKSISATTIPYWSNACGEFFYYFHEFEPTYNKFINNIELNVYNPRQYIVDNLSLNKCKELFIDVVKNI